MKQLLAALFSKNFSFFKLINVILLSSWVNCPRLKTREIPLNWWFLRSGENQGTQVNIYVVGNV